MKEIEFEEKFEEENNFNNKEENIDFLNMSERQIKVSLELRNIAQMFFQKESNGSSMITVTKADISRDLKKCNIYITVFPESKEKAAIDFAFRMRSALRTEIKKKLQIRTIPFVEIKLDNGEKARMKIGSMRLI